MRTISPLHKVLVHVCWLAMVLLVLSASPVMAKPVEPVGGTNSQRNAETLAGARQRAEILVRERDRNGLQQLLASARRSGDQRLTGEVLLQEGFLSFVLGENDAALDSYRKAEASFRQAGDLLGELQARLRETDIYLRRTDLGTVQTILNEVEPLLAQADAPSLTGDHLRQQTYLAFIRGDHSQTVALASRALAAYQKAGNLSGSSQVQRILGDLYGREGDFVPARAHYEQALEMGRGGGEPIFIGRALWGLGTVDFRRNEFQKALSSYIEAREVFSKARYPVGAGDVSQWEGDIYRIMGDRERALASFRVSFSSYSAAGSRVGMGSSLLSQGIIHHQQKQWREALALYERARTLYGSPDPSRNLNWVVGLAEVTYWKGAAQQDSGDLAGAQATLEQALSFSRQVGDSSIEGDVLLHQGEIRQRLGDLKGARDLFQRAREIYEGLGAHDSLSLALFRLAGLARVEGKPSEAGAAYEGAIREAEKLRARAGMETLKRTLLARVIDRYEEAAVFMIGLQPERAFTLVEGMKARSFLDQMAESAVDVTAGIDPALKLQRDQLESRRDQAAERLRRGSERKEELDDIDRQLEELRRVIRLKNPLYSRIQYPEPVQLAELRRNLHGDELVVEYFVGEGAVYRFLVASDTFKVERLAIPQSDLEREVNDALAGFGSNGKTDEEQRALTSSMAQRLMKLYDALLGGMGGLARGKRLIVVPDGVLARLPFEMLVQQLTPLTFAVQLYDIRYIQSATVLVTERQTGRAATTGGFVGFGDPVYDWEKFQAHQPERGAAGQSRGRGSLARSGYLRVRGILSRLQGSGIEVQEITGSFGKQKIAALPLLRDKARVEAAKGSALSGYSYIHFSTHGILESHFQALALTQDPSSREEGFLTFGDIMNCRFSSARMVVLSACETGLGVEERGEGVTGLTRAVMYAGSPAVVVSLWKVDDEQTRKLMTGLYGRLLEQGLSPSAALRQAKLDMVASSDELAASPFSWAAFVMYGE